MNTATNRRLVIIPVYNEERHIRSVLSATKTACPENTDILVVNDGSQDRTAQLAAEEQVIIHTHHTTQGYGQALQTGYRYAAEHHYRSFAQIDGDGQHAPDWLPRLFSILESTSADVVIGNRFLNPLLGGTYQAGPLRRIGMHFFAALCSCATKQSLTDPTSGFRVFSHRALPVLLHPAFPQAYPDADAIILLHKCGLSLRETAVPMFTKDERKSIHSGWRPLAYAFTMTASVLRAILRPAPLKISPKKCIF